MQLDDLLNRRELLDSLETEPLVDYLQKHGVLDEECCSKILSASESFDRNRELLRSLMKYHRCEDEERDLIEEMQKEANENHAHDANRCSGGEPIIPEEELKLSLNAFGLFMNALRHTGYHRLASLLDNERRIHKPTIGSRASLIGYHARSRRNGQLGIILQVGAVKVSAPEYGLELPPKEATSGPQSPAESGPPPPLVACQDSHWINLADFDAGEFDGDARRRAASYPDFRGLVAANGGGGDQEESDADSGCCCCCFRQRRVKGKRRAKGQKKQRRRSGQRAKVNGHPSFNGAKYELLPLPAARKASLATKSMSDDQIIKAYKKSSAMAKARQEDGLTEEERRVLQMKADILNEKSEQFYKLLYNTDSAVHENLLKYFEQDRGVLVLDCFFDDAFMIVAICTKRAKLMALKEDLANGSFCRDLEQCLVKPDVLSAVGVKAMKLAVDFDDTEFREALAELS